MGGGIVFLDTPSLPLKRENTCVGLVEPPAVPLDVLGTACYDFHSDETILLSAKEQRVLDDLLSTTESNISNCTRKLRLDSGYSVTQVDEESSHLLEKQRAITRALELKKRRLDALPPEPQMR